MTKANIQIKIRFKNINKNPLKNLNIKFIPDIDKRHIEETYDIGNLKETEAFYSERYGSILKRSFG